MVTNTRAVGGRWEREAENFLHCQGLRTLARNFNCRVGEIDLIMEHGECLVFAEIRYRKNSRFGSGAETVTRAKQGRIIRAAQKYLQLHRSRATQPCRFDVISFGNEQGRVAVEWIRNAFTADHC
jgi:putative endonuclease